MSFVYEHNLLLKAQKKLMKLITKCREHAELSLPEPIQGSYVGPSGVLPNHVIELWVQAASEEYLQSNAPNTTNDALFTVFLLHLIVLPYLSISDRSQKPVTLHPRLESKLRNHVVPKVLDALNQGLTKHGAERRPDIDGRVFLSLVVAFINDSTVGEDLSALLGPGPADGAQVLAASLCQHVESGRLSFSPAALSNALSRWRHEAGDVSPALSNEPSLRLLPFYNGAFDECLEPIHLDSEVVPSADSRPSSPSSSSSSSCSWESSTISESEDVNQKSGWFTNATIFTDDQHWRYSRKITGAFKEKGLVLYGERRDDDRPRSKKDLESLRRRKEKNHQGLMRDIYRHAITLIGAKGLPLERVVIPSAKRLVKDLPKENEQRRSPLQSPSVNPKLNKGPKAQQPKLNAAERLRQKIKDEKATKTLSELEVWWKEQLAQMDELSTPEKKLELLSRIRGNAKRMEVPWLRTETLLYQVHLDVSRWIHDRKRGEPRVQAQHCVSILRAASEIHRIGVASDAAKTFLRSLLEVIGIPDLEILETSSAEPTETTKNLLTFQPVQFTHGAPSKRPLYPFLKLPSHAIEFQLEHYGVYMDRSMDGQ
ncbi:hypothetical protein FRC01_011871, partial [Tulasnella sp. 417]